MALIAAIDDFNPLLAILTTPERSTHNVDATHARPVIHRISIFEKPSESMSKGVMSTASAAGGSCSLPVLADIVVCCPHRRSFVAVPASSGKRKSPESEFLLGAPRATGFRSPDSGGAGETMLV